MGGAVGATPVAVGECTGTRKVADAVAGVLRGRVGIGVGEAVGAAVAERADVGTDAVINGAVRTAGLIAVAATGAYVGRPRAVET